MKPYVVTGAIGAVLLGSLAVIFTAVARQRDREEGCRINLHYLWMCANEASPKDRWRWDDVPTGSSFWLSHERWPRAAVRPITPEMLLCPLKGAAAGRRGTDYRGPRSPFGQMKADDPIGADRPGNHGPGRGGNVLLGSGAVFPARETDAEWLRAAGTTSD